MPLFRYKGYRGTVEYDKKQQVFFGKVIDIIPDLVTYQADGYIELYKEFKISIDLYIETNEELGR